MCNRTFSVDEKGACVCVAGQRIYDLIQQASKSIDKAEIRDLVEQADEWLYLIKDYVYSAKERWDIEDDYE